MILLITAGGIATLLIYVLVACIVLGVIYWLINTIAPEPLRRYAIAVVVVLAAILLIYLLLGLVGGGGLSIK